MAALRSRRGATLLGFAVVMTVACVLLGLWQLDRYELRGQRNDAVRTALDADPVPLHSLVPTDTSIEAVPDEVEWRQVSVTGQYDPDGALALRLRPVEGQPGVHALAPLVLADGRSVLIDRGFLATGPGSTDSLAVPDPAQGTVELVGRVRLAESGRGAGLDAEASPPSIRFVDLADLQASMQAPLAPVWLELVEQTPAEDASLAPIPPPRLSAGPSLIYAVQWFLFGVIAVVGFVVLVRRESRTTPAEMAPPAVPPA
jgi:cytochrome oxidase assembly protein ShyY1